MSVVKFSVMEYVFSFLYATRDAWLCNLRAHGRRYNCCIMFLVPGGVRDTLSEVAPLRIVRVSMFDTAKSLRAFSVPKAMMSVSVDFSLTYIFEWPDYWQ